MTAIAFHQKGLPGWIPPRIGNIYFGPKWFGFVTKPRVFPPPPAPLTRTSPWVRICLIPDPSVNKFGVL